ncbi:MAG TPA: transporter [Negativicutes bacterium]|nr:transporter [Negativicutes bacterium]
MKRMLFLVPLLLCCLVLGPRTAGATEGGSSYYFPGSSTTFVTAVTPEPGFMVADQVLYFKGYASKAVLRGHVNLELDSSAVYNYMAGFYTFKKPVFGGRLQIGAAIPSTGNVNVNVSADSTLGSRNLSGNSNGFGDTVASASLYWKKSDIFYKLTQSVYIPTGAYTAGNIANVGRNYWAFDTSLAMTWMNKKGTEISITPGILINTKNQGTDYQSGNEFHIDVAVNQFLKPNVAVGLHGYYYSQMSDDSGSGAVLGGFRGRSLGFGPAILWMPKFGKGNLSVVAKWLRDVDDTNRMHGDYGQFIIGYKF